MKLQILFQYELNEDLINKLETETTEFAIKRGSKYLGWGLCGLTESYKRVPAVYTKEGNVVHLPNSSSNIGIRLITNYSEIKETCKETKQIDERFIEVEYGEYPQNCAEYEKQEELDYDLLNGRLKDTGKTYTSNDTIYSQSVELKEVVDKDGNKYINKNSTWYEVNPVKWVVDLKTGKAMSKYIMAGGVGFGDLNPTRYHYEYMLKSTNNLYGFLKKLEQDIIPSRVSFELEDPIIGRNAWELHSPMPKENNKDLYIISPEKIKKLGSI